MPCFVEDGIGGFDIGGIDKEVDVLRAAQSGIAVETLCQRDALQHQNP